MKGVVCKFGSILVPKSKMCQVQKRSMGLITRQWGEFAVLACSFLAVKYWLGKGHQKQNIIFLAERKRFYKNVSVYKEERVGREVFGVKLDSRLLRTPLRNQFLVPSEPLALAVAQEWDCQEKLVQLPLMHLTALCNTVLDAVGTCGTGSSHSAEEGGVVGVSEGDVASAVNYLTTDMLW